MQALNKLHWILLLLFIFSIRTMAGEMTSVLVIGDSHACGPFGMALVNGLSARGFHVDAYCASGSSPVHWWKGDETTHFTCESWSSDSQSSSPKRGPCLGSTNIPTLKSLLEKKHYQKVLIELGTNTLASPIADQSYTALAKVVEEAEAKCIWVGPAHLRPDQAERK